MSSVMLDDVAVPHGRIENETPYDKVARHEYDRSDVNHITELGKGIVDVEVVGWFDTLAEEDALRAKCAQAGEKKLYYPSTMGESADRYWLVQTSSLRPYTLTGGGRGFSFMAWAADPFPYVSATDTHVWTT